MVPEEIKQKGDDIYKKLAKHLSALGMGYPEKEELLEILRENFSEQEAEIALAIPSRVIPFQPVSVSTIARKLHMTVEEVEQKLAMLAHRGLLFCARMESGERGYAL